MNRVGATGVRGKEAAAVDAILPIGVVYIRYLMMQACRRYLLGRFVCLVDACGGGSTSRLYRATIILSHHDVSSLFYPTVLTEGMTRSYGEDRAGSAWGSQRWRDIMVIFAMTIGFWMGQKYQLVQV